MELTQIKVDRGIKLVLGVIFSVIVISQPELVLPT